ncbi:MAG: sigma factor [Cyanobacteria bacterium P01_D01_bin.115]
MFSPLIYTIAWRVLNNGPEAEDLTQEIFLNLWQKPAYAPIAPKTSNVAF